MRCCFADSCIFILVCLVLVRQPSAATRRRPIHSCGATVATRKRRESFSGQVGRWTHANENPRNSATAKGGVGAESLRVRVEDVFADTVRVLEAYASRRGALKGLCLADGVRRKSATLALASKARSRPTARPCVAVTRGVSLNRGGGAFSSGARVALYARRGDGGCICAARNYPKQWHSRATVIFVGPARDCSGASQWAVRRKASAKSELGTACAFRRCCVEGTQESRTADQGLAAERGGAEARVPLQLPRWRLLCASSDREPRLAPPIFSAPRAWARGTLAGEQNCLSSALTR
jgi:hypothetical protein